MKNLKKKLRNIPDALSIHDDIAMSRNDTDDHVWALKASFQVIKENILALNKKNMNVINHQWNYLVFFIKWFLYWTQKSKIFRKSWCSKEQRQT